jgi:hypothetical protein
LKKASIWSKKIKDQIVAVSLYIFLIQGIMAANCQQVFRPISGHGPQEGNQTDKYLGLAYIKENTLKLSLLSATMRALAMEINDYEQILEQKKQALPNTDEVVYIEYTIAKLKELLIKTALQNHEDYKLPEKRHVTVNMARSYYYGTMLELEGKSAKQFQFCIAGIYGDDFSILEPGRRYDFEIYLLIPKSSDWPGVSSYYVFIMPPADPGHGFSMPDAVPNSAPHF